MIQILLEILTPAFFMIATGYFCAYKNILPEKSKVILAKFVLTVSLPLFIFANLSQLPRTLSLPFKPLYICLFASMGLYLILFFYHHVYRKKSKQVAAIQAFTLSFPALALLGSPILTHVLKTPTATLLMTANFVTMAIMIPLTFALASSPLFDKKLDSPLKCLFIFLRHPLFFYPGLGLIFGECQIPVPHLLLAGLLIVGSITAFMSLFVLGMMLDSKKIIPDKNKLTRLLLNSIIKLIIQPFIVITLSLLFGLSAQLTIESILLFSLPCAGVSIMFACYFEVKAVEISQTVLLSILLSIISLPVMVYVLHYYFHSA